MAAAYYVQIELDASLVLRISFEHIGQFQKSALIHPKPLSARCAAGGSERIGL
jgi:hypothetical protein